MMRLFILAFVVGLLSACHQPSTTDHLERQELQEMSFSEQTLAQYSWQLIEAKDANSQHIDALFLASEPSQPITLKFADKTLYIGNLFCNLNSIDIYFKSNLLYVKQPIITTMIGCPDNITLRESTMFDILVSHPALYLQSRKGQIQLMIETPKKDKLIFNVFKINN